MPRPRGSAHGLPASILAGTGVALLTLGIAAAGASLDYQAGIRQSKSRLDGIGQSMVEGLHRELRDISFFLLAVDRLQPDDHSDIQVRLDLLAGYPHVAAVGHAPGDRSPVVWSTQVLSTAITPIGPDMLEEANLGLDSLIMYRTIGSHLMMTHPYPVQGDRVWDLVLVDMARAVDDVVPATFARDLIWDLRPVPGIDSTRAAPDRHREYLILDGSTAWLLELGWTEQAKARMGLGIDWWLIGAGVLVALITGTLSARWMRRRYLDADVRSNEDLVEQKDLLLLAISHQMRTPLTGIIGFLRLALDEPEDQMSITQRRELARMALGEAELVAEIVEDLLLSTRIDYQQLVVVERTVAVEGLLADIFRATARDSETLRFVDPTTETLIVADPLRVRQLFRNILSGGRDEGSTHWDVTVSTDNETVEVTLIPDVIVAPRSERLIPDQVALPQGLSAVQPRLGIARKLCLLMNGSLEVVQGRRRTEIRVSLPAAKTGTPPRISASRPREPRAHHRGKGRTSHQETTS